MSALIRRLTFIGLALFIILGLSSGPTTLAAVGASTPFSGNLMTVNPQYQRVGASTTTATDCASVEGGSYYYNVFNVTVITSGIYTIDLTTAAFGDTYLGLYQPSFDAANPLGNCLAYNDNGGTLSRIPVLMMAGTPHVVIVTSKNAGQTGAFGGEITGPDVVGVVNVTPIIVPTAGGSVAQPANVWFQGYHDSRINWREVYSPVALYGADYGSGQLGLHIYNIGAGSPEAAFFVSPQMIAAAPERPAQNTLIAQTPDGHIQVYRLTSGWFQVRGGPNAEGKISIITFDRLCIGFDCAVYTLEEIDPR